MIFVSPAKHGRRIGIMTPSASSAYSASPSDFGFRSVTFEGMHQFHSKFIEGYSIIKYGSSLNLEVIRTILAEFWPFFLRICLNCGFRSITFEGMPQFHSQFTER